ncbi:aconitate hydratase, putative [Plasmodium vivax]|uniref:Aconitate hydratase n=3 Tax=Plasmodium vivax TaxID=5855 RepID=A0A1G4H0X2_PLAVI|nr:aconitate hydratase I [Plasmodium vivax Mauritania I]KMZ98308.1 aconitate hydratase I [Plasmodium vivax North Korean]SCO68512.1 aconitate hydratase, putative [Plasmodium vivax]SCO73976.1 aconitate hydratase, putative [Plasmodium vivax]VUZ97404.1 aconitate hydratase, putative [Plasmodium vivax]
MKHLHGNLGSCVRTYCSKGNPFEKVRRKLGQGGLSYYDLNELHDSRIRSLPYSIRILLESAVRNCDNLKVTEENVETILSWRDNCRKKKEVPFMPARVLLQDLTGVPCIVDLATMRDTAAMLGGDANKINPLIPVDLVIDHSVQVDHSRSPEARELNEKKEFERNLERFKFLKWGMHSFKNMLILPPGSGIVHQINLEYLAHCVFNNQGMLYPDSLVGTDSHTTMINGLGILGWGVGGIEAEATMLGLPISMTLPEVVGINVVGKLSDHLLSTDVVLYITSFLRKEVGVVNKYVEFFGPSLKDLKLGDRATIANMAPEYGATVGFFGVDDTTLEYLLQTGRDKEKVTLIREYLIKNALFNDYMDHIEYTDVYTLDLSKLSLSVSGPKRPHDNVLLSNLHTDFSACLESPVGFKGYDVPEEEREKVIPFSYKDEKRYTLTHGSVVLAAITSCTNTSNSSSMIAAGLLAKKAVEHGIEAIPYIKSSLSPGSKTVQKYLEAGGLLHYLEKLGFYNVGFGCMTCIGNSGHLDKEVEDVINENDLICSSVLSGNRNFEGRIHPLVKANYLASPVLVVLLSLIGNVNVDVASYTFTGKGGIQIKALDLIPKKEEINAYEEQYLKPQMYTDIYKNVKYVNQYWNDIKIKKEKLYEWDANSTYIHKPPFFEHMKVEAEKIHDIKNAHMLLLLGDSITTDHISPAGMIHKSSEAYKFLKSKNVKDEDLNTYGARRGNDQVMVRGTFANIRLINKLCPDKGPNTVHIPSKRLMSVYEAAMQYKQDNVDVIVVAGKEYGCGSSRDWAAKGSYLLGVKAILAESFERIHRSNLVGMSVLPLQFLNNESAAYYNMDGTETFSIALNQGELRPQQHIQVQMTQRGKTTSFDVLCRIDTEIEVKYFKNGGILKYVLRSLVKG